MATHTLVYLGFFETSFAKLHPGQSRYWRKDDDVAAPGNVVESPPSHIKGRRFGFMERSGKSFVIVSVDRVVLRAPVLFIGGRHGPKAPGPAWDKLDDDVAMRIIADAIVANPESRDILAAMLRGLSEAG